MKWVLRTSRIIVGTGEGKPVFRSLEDCPSDIKRKLRDTLPGSNSCTIMITNREALKAIRERAIHAPNQTRRPASNLQKETQHMLLPRWQAVAISLLGLMAAMVGLLVWAMRSI